jgi:branched-subunit amino acid ABC-type transport system permease component
MRQIIAKLFPAKEETGARLGAYGFFIAIVGGVLAFSGFLAVGYWIGLTGALIGLGGIVTHFVMNWRTIFRIDR